MSGPSCECPCLNLNYTRQRRLTVSLYRTATRHGPVRTAPLVTESAPTILLHAHLAGSTVASGRPPHTALTARTDFDSKGVTAADVSHRTIKYRLHDLGPPRDASQATSDWLQLVEPLFKDLDTAMLPESPDLCKCCAEAKTLRELDHHMASDRDKTPPPAAQDGRGYGFAGLPHASTGDRYFPMI